MKKLFFAFALLAFVGTTAVAINVINHNTVELDADGGDKKKCCKKGDKEACKKGDKECCKKGDKKECKKGDKKACCKKGDDTKSASADTAEGEVKEEAPAKQSCCAKKSAKSCHKKAEDKK